MKAPVNLSKLVAIYNEHMKPQVEAVFADDGYGRAEDFHFWDGIVESTAVLNNDIEALSGQLHHMKIAMRQPAVHHLYDGREVKLSLTPGETQVWVLERALKKKDNGSVKIVVHADNPLNIYISQIEKYPDEDNYTWKVVGRTDQTFRLLPKDGKLRAGHLYIAISCSGKTASYKLVGSIIESDEERWSKRTTGKNGMQPAVVGALENKLEVLNCCFCFVHSVLNFL
jgi:hypothetical protein